MCVGQEPWLLFTCRPRQDLVLLCVIDHKHSCLWCPFPLPQPYLIDSACPELLSLHTGVIQ